MKCRQKSLCTGRLTATFYRIQVREATRYAMFLMDMEGIVVAWNAGVQNLLGYSENEFLGKPASIIFTPPDKAFEVREAELKLAAENGYYSDIRWRIFGLFKRLAQK
jgi:PAS domain S-box-containing protein